MLQISVNVTKVSSGTTRQVVGTIPTVGNNILNIFISHVRQSAALSSAHSTRNGSRIRQKVGNGVS